MSTKIHFWRIAGIFLLITVLVLMLQWRYDQGGAQDMMTQMMGQSMGEMMRMMHASNITLVQLFQWQDQGGGLRGTQQMGQIADLQWMHGFSTNTIYVMLPFILAGTMFLLITWYK